MEDKITVGVYGGRGSTGKELCRLLLDHRNVGKIIPASKGDEDFDTACPNLKGSGLKFVSPEELEARASELDVVFLRGEGGESLRQAPLFLEKGVKVIDLGGDFRLTRKNYESTYGREHKAPQLLEEAVYGIPEFNREKIKGARLIANPGCYVITGMFALYPLLKEGIIQTDHIPIFAINGTTGGKSEPTKGLMHANVYGNILFYNLDGHRHASEFEEKIEEITGQKPRVNLTVGHGDFTTGIALAATPLVKPEYQGKLSREELLDIFQRHYAGERFIRVNNSIGSSTGAPKESAKNYDLGAQMSHIRGTNYCDIGLDYDKRIGVVRVIAAADNLVRGSAGTAIQNMNLMFGFVEAEGLRGYSGL